MNFCPNCEQLIPAWIAALPLVPIIYLWLKGKLRKLTPSQVVGILALIGLLITLGVCVITYLNDAQTILETWSKVHDVPVPTPIPCPDCFK